MTSIGIIISVDPTILNSNLAPHVDSRELHIETTRIVNMNDKGRYA
jgi:hypothetical protein